MDLSAEQIAALKQKHGDDLVAIATPGGIPMVFTKPSKEVWTYYQDGLTKDKVTKTACFLRLAMDCVVMPQGEEAARLFKAYPGMPTIVAGELSKLAGLSDELDIKKL